MSNRSGADGRGDHWDDLDAALAGLFRDDPDGDGFPDAPVSPAPVAVAGAEIEPDVSVAITMEIVMDAEAVRRPGPSARRPRPAGPAGSRGGASSEAVRVGSSEAARVASSEGARGASSKVAQAGALKAASGAALLAALETAPKAALLAALEAGPKVAPEVSPKTAPKAVPEAAPETAPAAKPATAGPSTVAAEAAAEVAVEEIDEATADLIRRAGYRPPEIDPAAPGRCVAPGRPGLGRHHASGRIRIEWEARYMRTLVLVDLMAAFLAGAVAFTVRFGGEVTAYNQGYVVLTGMLPLVMIFTLAVNRAYERRFLFVGTDEYQRVLRAGLTMTATAAILSYAFDVGLARGYVVLALPSATLASLIGRFGLRKHLHARRARGRCLRRVIVVGHELAVVGVVHQLSRQPYHGLEVVGCCLPPVHDGNVGLPVYGTFDDVAVAVRAARADTVIILSCPELDGQMLRRLAWRLEREDIDLIVASTLVDVAGARTTIRPVEGLPMLHIEHPRLSGASRVVKSVFDRVGAALGLIVLSPLLLAIGVWIKRDASGPVFFRQIRVGKGGREFVIFKFRTMCTDAEARLAALKPGPDGSVLFKMRDDPRVTRVGRLLRRLSLDELPQLINVLLGEMSLVGPRPPLPEEVAAYPSDMRRRLAVSPGMTGLWQVSGRSDLSWEDTVRLDLRYVENWSFSLDLVILLRTLTAVCRSSGAY